MRQLLARIIAMFRRSADDADFAQELESHVEMLTADNLARGMSAAEARRAARLKVGAASSLAVQHRDARSLPVLEDLFQDLRFAARLLVKERWFSAAAIAAIALGIGANTVGFTIINAAFLRGFDFTEADRLQAISWRPATARRGSASYLELEELRARTTSFSGIAAWTFGAHNISDDHAAPEQTQGSRITGNHFEVLRQQPLLGRGFTAHDERRDAEPVVIIGYEIWTRRYAQDPNVLGRTLRVNGEPATIIGVMPERMKFPENSELWLPFVPTDAQLSRTVRPLWALGRLADGVSRESARAEIDALAHQLRAAHPDDTKNFTGMNFETLHQRFLNGAAPRMFMVVMGAVVFVLLIACANVANLLLSRSMYRAREVAVRYSIGATRWRIVRQLLAESVLLSSIGGAIGLVIAARAVQAFDAAVDPTLRPYWLNFTIDYQVLGYVAAICVATGVLFGLTPALQVSAHHQADTLKEGARSMAGNRRAGRLGNGLVIAELALTLVLLGGAGLMLRSFGALYAMDPGINVESLMRMRMQLPPGKYPTPEARLRFFEQLEPKLGAIPGVHAAALTTSVPPLDDEERRVEIEGRPTPDNPPWAPTVTITPAYFDVLGAPVARGRRFTEADGSAGAESVIVSKVFADRFFPGDDPIGRRIRFLPRASDRNPPPEPWRTIVGVSERIRQGSPDEAFRSALVYIPFRQSPPRTASILIRSALPPNNVMNLVRREVQSLDVDQPVFAIQTLQQVMAEERSIYGVFATLFALLAAIGLVLSAVGIYGVMAFAVTQRTQEIGIRMAVGAQRWQVSWLFLKRGLVQLTIAFLLGLPAAFALGIVARFRLVDVEPGDPLTMIGITAIVAIVALVSCVLPAHRAARVDPVIALRSD